MNYNKNYIRSEEYTYDVSVIVASYNPSIDKLLFTIDSILNQKKVYVEIIVTDDGSKNNHFEKIKQYFKENSFFDYRLIDHKNNQGTVLNISDGVKIAKGEYLKVISPGDVLAFDDILFRWIQAITNSEYEWSFSDAYYYSEMNGNYSILEKYANPQLVKPYIDNKTDLCRWNYVVNDDLAIGAALLCKTYLFREYLDRIIYKVKYAEDNVWRLMMYDGILPYYFPEETVLYECNTGISNSPNNRWAKLLKADWDATNQIMLENSNENDDFQKKMGKYVFKKYSNNVLLRKIEKAFIPGRIIFVIKRKYFPRTSNTEYDFKKLGEK